MSPNRGWRGRRHYNENQDDPYYRYGGSSYSSSHGQPYGYDYRSNGYYADAQPSQRYNYWHDGEQYHAQNYYHDHHEHGNGYNHPEGSYRRQRNRRSDSPQRNYHSPPPPPSAEPDSAYMTLSLEPSHIVDDPRVSRKLLVLDLNGTLLIRSQHSRARDAYGGVHTSSAPRLRAVQPRPYIPAFRAYLFAPETREWLDTMVWSSAQPHSVADMVDKVFGNAKSKLVAVWNRGSLGLSKEDYHRKALTTKDLTKPWALLPLGASTAEIAVPLEAGYAAEQAGLASSIAHSALTTLLLDDSPHKARLQPYNHVCIPEYTSSFRAKDLQQFQHEKTTRVPKLKKRKRKTNEFVPDQSQSAEMVLPSSDLDPTTISSTSTDVEKSSIPVPSAERADISSQSCAEPYDPTILAVIGVLDEIKNQSSVAGWIRAGGLWDIVPVPEAEAEGESIVIPPASDANMVEDLQSPTDPQDVQPLTKKELRAAQKLAAKQRKRAEQAALSAGQPVLIADKEVIPTGNDESTMADILVEDVPAAAPSVSVESVGMWFNDEQTLSYWVRRGRQALDSLGIEADHGVTG
ncbi:uncharacterized protein F5891DRAFT_1019573 [Suillus fuscotomentosus]|uniref:Mitochondrial import inner membrane translocase subunit TIM50 n=1 Tax=Suillus fuscotomentosus TaxID=1912939 RepID=A0AAD4HNT8_9AGAM|nr:uncharacterized protein F5891DRAFT_1019573 [Suillus fuscotomentosus]KAG1903463.1 hypothetical protein F5891DRAFT_1019573 [Suillus fuscotomentosus]